MKNMSLFITGFIQVFFVSINTYFLAKELYVGVLIASFAISLVWSFNVKRVAFGALGDRFLYAGGAACGALSGLASSAFLLRILNTVF
jgi:hypothetical protein